jgi:hypothetical protein
LAGVELLGALDDQRGGLAVAVEVVVLVRIAAHQRQEVGGVVVVGDEAVAGDLEGAVGGASSAAP